MSTGTANPTPSPPPLDDLICELMPITRPRALSSGPPELPRLIAASVWIASPMRNWVSDSMSRSSAEMTPTDSDCSSPNGDPIAATGDPTSRSREEPSWSGVSVSPSGSIFSRPTSAFRSVPTIFAGTRLPSANCDVDVAGAVELGRLAEHDVRVGRDVALAVEHEARAEAALAAARPACASPKVEMIVTTPGDESLVDRLRVERAVLADVARSR